MKKVAIIVKAGLCLFLCMGLAATQVLAEDNEAVAEKLVNLLPEENQRPDYYTGARGFMNEEDIPADNGGPLEAGLYIMSWLVLSPPIKLGAGGGAASIAAKDIYKTYVGGAEDEVAGDSKNWPVAGMKAKNQNESGEDMYWIPINFEDLIDAGQGAANSGNQFDWAEWGGQGLNQFHEYMFCLVKWNSGGAIAFAAGSDDPEQTYVGDELVCEGLGDRNWTADTDRGEFTAPAGEWVAILAEVGENGGECGYTLEVQPPPDDHTLDVEMAMAVNSSGKLASTWGGVKAAH